MAVRVVIRWRMKLLWNCFEAELCGERSWLAVEVAERARAGCRTLPGAMPAPERLKVKRLASDLTDGSGSLQLSRYTDAMLN